MRLFAFTALASFAALSLACSSPSRLPSGRERTPRPRAAEAPLREPSLSPARYVLTQDMGSLFDDYSESSTMAKTEPAIVDGTRLLVDAGVIVASAGGEPRFSGFRSLPARLGGGFVLWSDEATYKADTFLGPLRRIIDTPASGGARPWLSSFLLRTERGVLEVDPKSLAVRRLAPKIAAGFVDGVAVDDKRAVYVDSVGRTRATSDGGVVFEDITARRGFLAVALREASDGVTLNPLSGQVELYLAPGGALGPIDDAILARARAAMGGRYFTPPSLEITPSRALAAPDIANAVAAGALLPGDRALVARRLGLRLVSTRSARAIDDTDLRGVSEWLSHCQPVVSLAQVGSPALNDPEILLACAHARGAHVLRSEGEMGAPVLAAASSDRGGFVVGARGRLAFLGRLGADPPSAAEFARNNAPPPPPPDGAGGGDPTSPGEMGEPQEPAAAPPPSDASPKAAQEDVFVSVYRGGGRWSEHHVGGRYAKHLYRWIPADDGSAVALVFESKGKKSEGNVEKSGTIGPGTTSPGVRVVTIDPADEAFGGGSLPPVITPSSEPPYRSIDPDFWLDDDGSIRGWARLPLLDGGSRDEKPLGGPVAGVRIDTSGTIERFPLPPDTEHVVRGGRFALAMASKEDKQLYFETTDGGRTWSAIAAPPVGRMEPPDDAAAPFACSALGCALGGGLVRLGFGGAPPDEAESKLAADTQGAPINPPMPAPITNVVVCTADKNDDVIPPAREEPTSGPAAPITIRTQASGPLGRASNGVWSANVIAPFQPSARPRSISVRDPSIGAALHGQIAPLLAGSKSAPPGGPAVDLVLLSEKGSVRLGASSPSLAPFEYGGRVAAFADGPDGALVGIDADRGFLVLSRGGPARPVLRISRADDASRARITLAKRIDPKAADGALAIVLYSTTSGDVAAGSLDLAAAEIGPLRPLGALTSMEEASSPACAPDRLLMRFVADIPMGVRLRTKGGRVLADTTASWVALLAATPDHLCVEGLELRLPAGLSSILSVRFPARGPSSASLRGLGGSLSLSCSIEPRPAAP